MAQELQVPLLEVVFEPLRKMLVRPMIHPLAAAMARAMRGTPNETPVGVNRIVNTYTGWTYAQAYGSSTVGPDSRRPCCLDISDMENPGRCYWCGDHLPHEKD